MKTPEDDFHLGRTVLERNLVSREAFLECLFQLAHERKSGMPRPLGVLLAARGLITEEEFNGILAERMQSSTTRRFPSETEIGRLLVAAGLLSKENVQECVKLQEDLRSTGASVPALGELVVSRGYVTQPQIMRVLAYQKKVLFACGGCGMRISAVVPPAGQRYRCKKCGGSLQQVGTPRAPEASGALSLREADHGEDTQIEIDRAVAAYLKQKSIVRRDQLRENQRLQMEFARYGLVVPLLELMRRNGAITLEQQRGIETTDFGKIVRDTDWKNQSVPGYRLRQRVASGGFASIWTADALFEENRVAVKVLHPERAKDPRSVARFEWEAMLLRRFACPRIVRGHDHGFDRGSHYLIMEYVEGRSLGQTLSESGAFSVRDSLQVTMQVAEALRYLHSQGYLHRDVKPDNVLIDPSGSVKLCDLGFAVPIPRNAPGGDRAKTAVGTTGYMSPEVLRGEGITKMGADIYSLGILLYALLTGHEPFEGASSEEIVTEQIETGMPVPNLMIVDAPPHVIQLLKRMMHPDRTKRFSTVDEVIGSLERLIAA